MRIAALSTLLLLAGAPATRAGMVLYTWAPMVGGGTYQYRSNGQMGTYTSSDGHLTIGWDPDNPASDYAVGAVGAPINESFGAGGGGAAGSLTIQFAGDSLALSGMAFGSQIFVELAGLPGPLAPSGLPLSLEGFLQNPANVSGGAGGYALPVDFSFRGVAAEGAPEPSALLMLAIGVGIVALSRGGRRTAARSWWPWATG